MVPLPTCSREGLAPAISDVRRDQQSDHRTSEADDGDSNVHVHDPGGDESRFEGVADVVRVWEEHVPVLYAVDDTVAMIGSADVLSGTHHDGDAVEVSRSRLTGTVLGTYLGTYWPAATEAYVTEPYPLPHTFDWFRQAALHARLHEMAGTDLWPRSKRGAAT